VTRTKLILSILITLICAVCIRIPFFEVPMISDEGGYAYVAHFWSDQYMPYRDMPFDRPQGIFLLYRIALAFGEDIGAIRMFAAAWNALTAVAIMLCIGAVFPLRRVFGASLLGGLLYAVFSTAPRIEGFTANAEIFTLLPLTVAALFTWRRQWLWAGLAAGVATAIKPTGVAGLLLALSWLLVTRVPRRAALSLLAGYAIAPGLCLIHGALLDWPAYWASFVDRRLLLYSAASTGIGEQLGMLVQGVKDTASAWLFLALATAYTALKQRNRTAAFLGLWVVSSWCGMAMGGLWHWHYFQQLIPPLAVGAGGCLVAYDMRQNNRLVNMIWAVALVGALALFIRSDMPFWFQQPKDISTNLYHRGAYLVSDDVGRLVRKYTRPDERIYVAFAEAEVYFSSQRKAAVPQLFYRDIEFSEELFNEVITSLNDGVPAIVIKSHNPPPAFMSKDQFIALLQRRYELAGRAGPLQIWVRQEPTR
jgi:hypothetical protein